MECKERIQTDEKGKQNFTMQNTKITFSQLKLDLWRNCEADVEKSNDKEECRRQESHRLLAQQRG
jgi:hypothetical protein